VIAALIKACRFHTYIFGTAEKLLATATPKRRGCVLSSQPSNAGFLLQHKFPSATDESRRAKGSQKSFSS